MLNLIQAIKFSWASIDNSKLRSALTALGIIIGIAAVVANVSLGASFGQYFTDELGTQGSNFIIIYSQDVNIFHDKELNVIENTPGITGVSPARSQIEEVKYLSSKRQISIEGVTSDEQSISNLKLDSGTFIGDKDKYVAVIGYKVANEKFDKNLSLNNPIEITFKRRDGSNTTQEFIVKGILEKKKATLFNAGPDRDASIYIPIKTMNELLNVTDYTAFTARTDNPESVRDVSNDVDKRLSMHLGVSSRDIGNPDSKPYRIFNQADVIDQLNTVSSSLTILITIVALISLLVGSIGIMNIMLVTVTERTREIGILKSLGYNKKDILTIFILESAMIGLIGGFLGVILGIIGSYSVQSLLDIPHIFPTYLIFLGFSIAVIIGLLAGVYPANKAANMNPVEALRH